jgi:hypothetical protein
MIEIVSVPVAATEQVRGYMFDGSQSFRASRLHLTLRALQHIAT